MTLASSQVNKTEKGTKKVINYEDSRVIWKTDDKIRSKRKMEKCCSTGTNFNYER